VDTFTFPTNLISNEEGKIWCFNGRTCCGWGHKRCAPIVITKGDVLILEKRISGEREDFFQIRVGTETFLMPVGRVEGSLERNNFSFMQKLTV
jgi:hypothetical protein